MAVLFWIFFDQICPKWIKLDQTWSNWISHQSKNVTIKSCHIYRKVRNDYLIFDFFGSDLSKMDQTWSNFLARNGFLAVMAFLQKLLFIQNTFVTFEVAFWPEMVFWLEMAFFKWICLTSQSIERFGSPLMAESFQACFLQISFSFPKAFLKSNTIPKSTFLCQVFRK